MNDRLLVINGDRFVATFLSPSSKAIRLKIPCSIERYQTITEPKLLIAHASTHHAHGVQHLFHLLGCCGFDIFEKGLEKGLERGGLRGKDAGGAEDEVGVLQ